ncbi:DgyrCDS4951 [Dimorphilus gyrociliatus]|uniref:DgyrCDS4951 n=1 Tax=Dimorphilus gyrociliatus TaxID=2664684 RepID=A0A7I8VL34_9ANNE|nr:DgyrCDS4951 [Dimorphilus gyrociliatus]
MKKGLDETVRKKSIMDKTTISSRAKISKSAEKFRSRSLSSHRFKPKRCNKRRNDFTPNALSQFSDDLSWPFGLPGNSLPVSLNNSVEAHQNKPKSDDEKDPNNPIKTRVEIETITAPYNSRLPTSTPTKKRKNPSSVHSKGYLSTIKHIERKQHKNSNKENDEDCTCLEDLQATKCESNNELPSEGTVTDLLNGKENVIDNDSQKDCIEDDIKETIPKEQAPKDNNLNNNNGSESVEIRNTNRKDARDHRPYIYRDYRSKSRESRRDKCPHCKLLKGDAGNGIPKTRFHCRCQCVTKEANSSESSEESIAESDEEVDDDDNHSNETDDDDGDYDDDEDCHDNNDDHDIERRRDIEKKIPSCCLQTIKQLMNNRDYRHSDVEAKELHHPTTHRKEKKRKSSGKSKKISKKPSVSPDEKLSWNTQFSLALLPIKKENADLRRKIRLLEEKNTETERNLATESVIIKNMKDLEDKYYKINKVNQQLEDQVEKMKGERQTLVDMLKSRDDNHEKISRTWHSEKTSLLKELEIERVARTTLEKKYDKDVKHYKFLIKEIQQNLSRLLCELGQEPQVIVNCRKGSEKIGQGSTRGRQYEYFENDSAHNSHVFNSKPPSHSLEFKMNPSFANQFQTHGKKLSSGAQSAVEKMKSLINSATGDFNSKPLQTSSPRSKTSNQDFYPNHFDERSEKTSIWNDQNADLYYYDTKKITLNGSSIDKQSYSRTLFENGVSETKYGKRSGTRKRYGELNTNANASLDSSSLDSDDTLLNMDAKLINSKEIETINGDDTSTEYFFLPGCNSPAKLKSNKDILKMTADDEEADYARLNEDNNRPISKPISEYSVEESRLSVSEYFKKYEKTRPKSDLVSSVSVDTYTTEKRQKDYTNFQKGLRSIDESIAKIQMHLVEDIETSFNK